MKILIDNVSGKIVDNLNIDQLSLFQKECSFKVIGSDFKQAAFKIKSHGHCEWDGYKKLFDVQTRKFPIGLLHRICSFMSKYGIQYEIINKRIILNVENVYEYDVNILRDYQKECIMKSIISGNGILKVATGGGKTVIAGCTIGALGVNSVFIVHTRDLLYQAKESFQRLFPNEVIGQIGDGIIEYGRITVATMQTLAILANIDIEKYSYDEENSEAENIKYELSKQNYSEFHSYINVVQCVMMDEVQIVCSQTAYKVRFLFEKASYAFGYSASPWRDDGSDMMIEAAFGNRIVDITASQLILDGYLVRPTIIINQTYYDINNQPEKYVDVYKKFITENVMRNIQIVNDAIDQYNLGRNTLILVTQINHGKILQDILQEMGHGVVFISGKSGMTRRKQTINDMRSGKKQLIIASSIADVGLDIPRLQSIIEAGAGKSSVTALQRLGRIMRPFEGKDNCYFITYRDRVKFISEHINRKIDIWSTEKEFNIIEVR